MSIVSIGVRYHLRVSWPDGFDKKVDNAFRKQGQHEGWEWEYNWDEHQAVFHCATEKELDAVWRWVKNESGLPIVKITCQEERFTVREIEHPPGFKPPA